MKQGFAEHKPFAERLKVVAIYPRHKGCVEVYAQHPREKWNATHPRGQRTQLRTIITSLMSFFVILGTSAPSAG
jgi:hypothetical protein